MDIDINTPPIVVNGRTEFNGAVGVLRPSIRPSMTMVGNFVQIRREDVINPKQRSFEDFVGDALNALASYSGGEDPLAVTNTFYLDPGEETGFPVFTVFSLEGASVDEQKISKFKAAVVFVASEITGQPSMFYGSSVQQLTEEELALLSAECRRFSVKHSGEKITSEFVVYAGFDDEVGLPIGGQLPRVADVEAVTELLDGLAWPDGYRESSNVVFLRIEDGADAAVSSICFQCCHTEVYDVLARARLERSRVRYRGCRIKSATGKKDMWRLDSVELTPAGAEGNKHFELTS